MNGDASGLWPTVTAIAVSVVGSGGLLAAWLGYKAKRMEVERDEEAKRRDREMKAMSDLVGIADAATRNVLAIVLDQNKECERRLSNAFQRIEGLEERARRRQDRIDVLERAMRDAGLPTPPAAG